MTRAGQFTVILLLAVGTGFVSDAHAQIPSSVNDRSDVDQPVAEDEAVDQASTQQEDTGSISATLPPDVEIRLGKWLKLSPGVMFQLRMTTNWREEVAVDERHVTQAFTIPRFRMWLTADVLTYLSMFVRAGVNSTGAFQLERLFGDFHWGDFHLRGGQFALPIYSEGENVAPHKTLGTDYSTVSIAYEPGSSQGVMFQYWPEKLRATFAFTNGFRTGFAEFNEGLDADMALTSTFEFLFLSNDWTRLKDFTSWRGDDALIKAGVGVHYQLGGQTGNTRDIDLLYLAADLRAEGNGWNAFGQFVWARIMEGDEIVNPNPDSTFDDFGFVVQGGAYLVKWLELYARYDMIVPEKGTRAVGNPPGNVTTDFRTMTGGLNFYLVPRTHLARVTLEYQYYFDPTTGSTVPVTPSQGILATDAGDQWVLRAQLVVSI